MIAILAGGIAFAAWYFLAGSGNGAKTTFNGVLEAVDVDVRTEVGGVVMSFFPREGDEINAGDPICALDTEKLEIQLRGGRAELAAQRAMLEAMEKGARGQELEQVRLALDQARIQKEQAEKDYGRLDRLYNGKHVSEREKETAKMAMDLAGDQERRAREQLSLAEEGAREEEIKAQRAVVDAVQAKVDYYAAQLEDATVTSPITGRLIERYLEPGELATPGGLVATVSDYSTLEVKVYVPEDRVGAIELGRKALVYLDSFPGEPMAGKVTHKSRQAEFTPKNVQTKEERTTLVYEVTVTVENPGELSTAGLPADVDFNVAPSN